VFRCFNLSHLSAIYLEIPSLGAYVKWRRATIYFCHVSPSVRPRGTPLLSMDGFSWHWGSDHFSKVCREKSSSMEIWEDWRALYMQTDIHMWSYVAHFFLEWEMFQTKVVEKIKTHFVFSIFYFFENRAFYEIMWKNILEQTRPHMTIWRMRIACWIPKATNTHSEYSLLSLCNNGCMNAPQYIHCLPCFIILV